jgi:hypothetical protein
VIREIRSEAGRRTITRLCHFTPARKLAHIASGETGILATNKLREDERAVFDATDLARLDRHETHICCSIQYPNAWYMDRARAKDVLFRDWVILLIDPRYLWTEGTLFCPRNAAADYGAQITQGDAGFRALFANTVLGAYRIQRSAKHLESCPTDNQAEVLIPDHIPLNEILGAVVQSETQARNEDARLRLLGIPKGTMNFVIAPVLFDKHALRDYISAGRIPEEQGWSTGEADDC